ncbi:butyrophilin subfamily 1 member A1-like isoform X2 [Labeo rohita]|uniref:Butyrophilin subfamily 1 member A1-like isoform X2 n=1 Tax=Labeo rohita TaxID=84645 RepID=A0A498M1F6_LABRO|nr:butyrophilin subfamily 1 member A1-like isoform X2 [Labeo rohita]
MNIVENRMNTVNYRMNRVKYRMNTVNYRMNTVENRMNTVNYRMNTVENRMRRGEYNTVKEQTKWYLGVTRESVNTKKRISLSPENGHWTVGRRDGTYRARDSSVGSFSLSVDPQRVGVFVDYEKGLVRFYDVESMCHIYSYTDQSFNEKLYPFVCLGYLWNENSTPLIICDDYE